jgi:hypothetical protein
VPGETNDTLVLADTRRVFTRRRFPKKADRPSADSETTSAFGARRTFDASEGILAASETDGFKKNRSTHKIPIALVEEIDDGVTSRLRTSYGRDAGEIRPDARFFVVEGVTGR